jgi:MscS family membrane protein
MLNGKLVSFLDHHFVEDFVKLLIIIISSIVVAYICKIFSYHISKILSKKQKDQVLVKAISRPVILLVFVLVLTTLFEVVKIYNQFVNYNILATIRNLSLVICIGWACLRYSELLQYKYLESKRKKSLDKGAVDALGKLTTIIVIIIAMIISMDILGFNIKGLVTFAGVGGLAVAFASKELLSNFFGTIIIYFDQPFIVGDFIKVSKGASGVVEYIGWRMTRIRTIEKIPLYIPNSIFASEIIENSTRRTHRMINEVVEIKHDNMLVMHNIIKDIKIFLDKHKKISSDQPIVVGFDAFGDASTTFIVRACVEFSHDSDFYDIKTDIMLYIYELIKKYEARAVSSRNITPDEIKCDLSNKEGEI